MGREVLVHVVTAIWSDSSNNKKLNLLAMIDVSDIIIIIIIIIIIYFRHYRYIHVQCVHRVK